MMTVLVLTLAVSYLLLTLFGFSIIAWALLQNELNNMSDVRPSM